MEWWYQSAEERMSAPTVYPPPPPPPPPKVILSPFVSGELFQGMLMRIFFELNLCSSIFIHTLGLFASDFPFISFVHRRYRLQCNYDIHPHPQ